MDQRYEPLFTPPWKIGNVEMENRIVMCPMGGTSQFGWIELNHFDKVAAEFFLNIAHNNVGLIIPGIAPLRDPIGGRWLYQNPGMFKELKAYMEQIDATGVTVKGKNGASQTLAADDVILAVSYTPAPAFAKGRHVHVISDACKVGNLRTVIWHGLEGGRTAVIKPH